MQKTAKLFMNGRSQAVRLPREFRFNADEVFVRKDEKTGDLILSEKTNDWESFFKLLDEVGPAEEEFMKGIKDPAAKPEDVF